MIEELKQKVFNGYQLTKADAYLLLDCDLEHLCNSADQLREHFCGNSFDICTIINGKSGKCSENCKFCAQSSHYTVDIDQYPLLSTDKIIADARYNANKGMLRYSVVTSGRRLNDDEIETICKTYTALGKSCNISLCASHGLLNYSQMVKLKNAGVQRYHNNLETSRRFFSSVCSSHTYDDKIQTIKDAILAGLEVCSGGIMGLGESMLDRIDMAFELLALGIKSIPINILNPVSGTPFEHLPIISLNEFRRIVAIFRFILPSSSIRLAGGRGLLADKGKSAFKSGANSAISGDMLTTAGISIMDDIKMIKELNYEVKLI